MTPLRRRLLPVAGALLLAGAGVAAFRPHDSHAAIGIKHTGPIITLSNGRAVQILTSISDSQTNVGEIDYTVHGPSGVHVLKVAYQKAWGSLTNRAVYVADQASTAYSTDTYVKTIKAGSAAVSVQVLVQSSTGKSAVNASGTENAHIAAKLNG